MDRSRYCAGARRQHDGHGLHQQWRVDWFDKLIRRHAKTSYRKLHILDLGSLEGLFTIEFARKGARTVGIEIREQHLERADFARRVLGLDNCLFIQGDVRSIPEGIGSFDVTICAGILYHLNFPDCVTFLQTAASHTSDLFLLDSHLPFDHFIESAAPLSPMKEYHLNGVTYRGREAIERSPEHEGPIYLWGSIDSPVSVWLSQADVVSIIQNCGFNLVERGFPGHQYCVCYPDRPTLAFKRSR